VGMDLELVGAVLQLVCLADRVPGQLPDLADRHEPGVELDRDRGPGDEASRFDGGDQVDAAIAPGFRHHVDDLTKQLLAPEQWRYVTKRDAGLRVPLDVPDVLLQLFGRAHTTERKYSRVLLNPSSSATSGSHPRTARALEMSGRRCFGSSIGRSRNSILLCEPARRTIIWASSSTVTSLGLPRLTGSSSAFSRAASTPRTR